MLASEARAQTLTKLILGHAVETVDVDHTHVRVRVGQHVFEDKRSEYPSEQLLANVVLAVEAQGYYRNAFDIGDLPETDVATIIWHGRYEADTALYMGTRIP